jgi:RNA polymerase sigma-70 factor (ECF subfamily)
VSLLSTVAPPAPETPEETTLVVRPDPLALARAEFTRFYLVSYPELRLVLTAMLGDSARVRRATAEAYARAWVRWPTVRRLEDIPAWLREAAARAYRSPRGRLITRWAGHRVPGQAGAASGLDREVLDALRRLPETQRRALVLHYLAGLPVDRVADEDGTSVGSVRARLAHAQLSLDLRLGAGRVARVLRDGRRCLPPARHAPAPPVASVFRLARRWRWTGRAATAVVTAVGVTAVLVALAQSFGPVAAAARPAGPLVPPTGSLPAVPAGPGTPRTHPPGPRVPSDPEPTRPGPGTPPEPRTPPGPRTPPHLGPRPPGRPPRGPGRDPHSAVPDPPSGGPGVAVRAAAAPLRLDRPVPAPREEHQPGPDYGTVDAPGPMWPGTGRRIPPESGSW